MMYNMPVLWSKLPKVFIIIKKHIIRASITQNDMSSYIIELIYLSFLISSLIAFTAAAMVLDVSIHSMSSSPAFFLS